MSDFLDLDLGGDFRHKLSDVVRFKKHDGKTLKAVLDEDPSYIEFMLDNNLIELDPEALTYLKHLDRGKIAQNKRKLNLKIIEETRALLTKVARELAARRMK